MSLLSQKSVFYFLEIYGLVIKHKLSVCRSYRRHFFFFSFLNNKYQQDFNSDWDLLSSTTCKFKSYIIFVINLVNNAVMGTDYVALDAGLFHICLH